VQLREKKRRALQRLATCESAVVALSGGVDSALLLALALDALGPSRLLAATGDSPSLAASDLDAARQTAAALGVRHVVLPTREMDRAEYRANLGDRCFHCRVELFEALARLADERGLACVVYGAIADDLSDDRPGMRAAEGLGVVAPLLEAGLIKNEVRELATQAGLAVADKPAGACLASRLPVGTSVTPDRLARVERAEEGLRALGFHQLRVRHHDEVGRVELDAEGLRRALDPELRRQIVGVLQAAGYRHATLDLEGYRTGGVPAEPEERSTDSPARRSEPNRDGGQ